MGAHEVATSCGICQAGCRVVATVEEGRLVKVVPDKNDPKGNLCPLGATAPSILYDRARIEKPLIRTGERGSGELREASWDEALDYAAGLMRTVLEEYGAHALASYFGRGVLRNPVYRLGSGEEAFLGQLGSPNDTNCSSICNLTSSRIAPYTTLGIPWLYHFPDLEHCDFVFIWGKNPQSDDGPRGLYKRIRAAQGRGAKLIVIDPRKTGMGEQADWWVPVTPGSDGALALAMLKIIVEEGLYDKAFVEGWTHGFDALCDRLGSLQLDTLSAQCGVSVGDIRKLTELFCSTARIPLIYYTGLEYQLTGTQAIRAVYTLWAITGKWDVEGAMYLDAWNMPNPQPMAVPEGMEPLGAKEYPVFYEFTAQGNFNQVPRAVLHNDPYPVRGIILSGGSPALSFPGGDLWREAYCALDCLIVFDRFLTEEVRYADVVFPVASLYESMRVVGTPSGSVVEGPTLKAPGEAREETIAFGQLAQRLGVGSRYPQNEEELADWLVVRPSPSALPFTVASSRERTYRKYETGDLRADGKPGFPTPTGKFEIASTILADAGCEPVPEYQDVRDIEGFDSTMWPLIMTTGARSPKRTGCVGGNLEAIGAGTDPIPYVDVHPDDAQAAGIADGDDIVVESPFGSAPFVARVCDIAKGAIHVPHGGGSIYMYGGWKEGAVNALNSLDYRDSITGFPMLKSMPCRISKRLAPQAG